MAESEGYILAIDPGPEKSAYATLNKDLKPVKFGIVTNEELLDDLNWDRLQRDYDVEHFAVEMVASYGMAVGKDIFETVFWIGRFWEAAHEFKEDRKRIYRKEVTVNLCGSAKAKDGNVRQALIDRFGVVGVKKNPGWFYGVSKDVWSAIAVGVTYADKYLGGATK